MYFFMFLSEFAVRLEFSSVNSLVGYLVISSYIVCHTLFAYELNDMTMVDEITTRVVCHFKMVLCKLRCILVLRGP